MERVALRRRPHWPSGQSEDSCSTCSFDHDCTELHTVDVGADLPIAMERRVPGSCQSADGSEQTEEPPSPKFGQTRTVKWKDRLHLHGKALQAEEEQPEKGTHDDRHCLIVVEQAWAGLYPEIPRRKDEKSRASNAVTPGASSSSSAALKEADSWRRRVNGCDSAVTSPSEESRAAGTDFSKAPFRRRLTDVQGKLQALAQEVRSHADLAGLPVDCCESDEMQAQCYGTERGHVRVHCQFSAFDTRLQDMESAFTILGDKVQSLLEQNQQKLCHEQQRQAWCSDSSRALESLSAQLHTETSSQIEGFAAHIRAEAEKQLAEIITHADEMLASADGKFKDLLARSDLQLSEHKQYISKLAEQSTRKLVAPGLVTNVEASVRDTVPSRASRPSLSSWGNLPSPASSVRGTSPCAAADAVKSQARQDHTPEGKLWEGPQVPRLFEERVVGIAPLRRGPESRSIATTPRGQTGTDAEASTPRTPRMTAERRVVEVHVQANSRGTKTEATASRAEGPHLRVVELTEPVTIRAWTSSIG